MKINIITVSIISIVGVLLVSQFSGIQERSKQQLKIDLERVATYSYNSGYN
jgi:type II secretory pathway pseudopilin PulG